MQLLLKNFPKNLKLAKPTPQASEEKALDFLIITLSTSFS